MKTQIKIEFTRSFSFCDLSFVMCFNNLSNLNKGHAENSKILLPITVVRFYGFV